MFSCQCIVNKFCELLQLLLHDNCQHNYCNTATLDYFEHVIYDFLNDKSSQKIIAVSNSTATSNIGINPSISIEPFLDALFYLEIPMGCYNSNLC